MKTSKAGLNIIKEHEGLRLNAYQDPVGIWTIGYGHTATAQQGQTITEKQAEALLIQDVQTAENAVNSQISAPINQNQFDALVSWTFNLGSGSLFRSTLKKKVNANPNDPSIKDEFMRWVNAGGQVLNGLVKRRAKEAELYFGEKKKLIQYGFLALIAAALLFFILKNDI